mmetsp:Transcript_47999/g.102806  ORF Transcript_47999/g.102806 Transcript_47999/m.102806 type:complete len:705 (+) Transcript_47999:55-2169(+)
MTRCIWSCLWSACVLSSPAFALSLQRRQTVTPVEKVLELLKKLGTQIEEEGKEEAVSYAKYATFCKNQTSEKEYAIGRSEELISKLEATVTSLASEIAQLETEMETAKGKITTEESAAVKTLETRNTTFQVYVETKTPLEEGITAIKEAIAHLEASRDSVRANTKAAALIQQVRQLALAIPSPSGSPRQLPALLQQNPKTYSYQSNEIIEILQDLLKTFTTELNDAEEAEATDRHQHEMVEGARANRVKALRKSITEKEELSARKAEEKSEKQQMLDEETADKTADEAFLKVLNTTCEEKATVYAQRSQTRTSELETISKAIEELGDVGQLYTANKKLTGLVSTARTVHRHQPALALVQVGASTDSETRQTVESKLDRLESQAKKLESSSLQKAVAELRSVAAASEEPVDHFVKVRGIIEDLVAQLEAEALAEADQKSFCDTEMEKSITKRDSFKLTLEGKQAEIEKDTAAVTVLGQSIAELEESLAALHKALQELTALRSEEKAANNATVFDAQEGAAAIKEAITILEKFYGSSATLLQDGFRAGYVPPNSDRYGKTVGDLAPNTTFSGEYEGKLSESKGIIGLLEIISSDFERTIATVEAAELAAQTAYDKQKGEMESEIDTKKGLKADQESEKKSLEDGLVTLKDDAKTASDLHAVALEELQQLKSSCVDSSESYAERRQKRQEEIDGLKQALQILEDWQK